MGNGFHVSTQRVDRSRWSVAATGELDVATAGYFEAAIAQVVESEASLIEVDLSGLTFIGSEGAHLLADAIVACRKEGRAFVVVAMSTFARRVLRMSGLEREVERPATLV